MRASSSLAIPVLIVALLATPSRDIAQSGGPCRDDVRQFCNHLEPGHGTRLACLQEHSGELSSACRAQLQERSERRTRAPGDGVTRAPHERRELP